MNIIATYIVFLPGRLPPSLRVDREDREYFPEMRKKKKKGKEKREKKDDEDENSFEDEFTTKRGSDEGRRSSNAIEPLVNPTLPLRGLE